MLAVAQLKAMGKQWQACAEATGLTPKTVRQYPCKYPGWDALVDHYRQQAFHTGVEEHFFAGALEALDALRQEFRSAAAQLRAMEKKAADGELDPDSAKSAISLSRATAYAADKYLNALGFVRYRARMAEMDAEQDKTGKVGQTVRVEGAKSLLDGLPDMTAEEKASAFKDLIGDGDGS